MRKAKRTEKQLTEDLNVVMKRLYKTLQGTKSERLQSLRDKFESEIQELEKSDKSEEMGDILELLRQLRPHAEIAEQYGKTRSYVSIIANKNGIWTPKAAIQELRNESSNGLSSEELAIKMGVYPEAIERIKQELESERQEKERKIQENAYKKKEKTEPSEEMKDTLELLKQIRPRAEIVEKYGKSLCYISEIANKNGIWSPRAVRQELKRESSKGLSNEELATKMGVYPEAIERVKQELESERQEKERKRSDETKKREKAAKMPQVEVNKNVPHVQEPKADIDVFLEMAREVVDIKIMAKRLKKGTGVINLYLTQYGIWRRSEIVRALDKMSNEQIASKGTVSIEAVKRIREQERAKAERRSSDFERNNRLEIQKREEVEKAREKRQFFAKAKKYKSIQQWEGSTGVSAFEIVVELRKLRNAGVASDSQLNLLEEWEKQNIAKISPQERQKNLKIAWGKYICSVENINMYSSKYAKSVVNLGAKGLLALYEDLLTELQYAYLCYGYIKMEEELQALKLGKEKLDLKESTLLALRQRIDEIQAKENERTKPETPTDGAGGER